VSLGRKSAPLPSPDLFINVPPFLTSSKTNRRNENNPTCHPVPAIHLLPRPSQPDVLTALLTCRQLPSMFTLKSYMAIKKVVGGAVEQSNTRLESRMKLCCTTLPQGWCYLMIFDQAQERFSPCAAPSQQITCPTPIHPPPSTLSY